MLRSRHHRRNLVVAVVFINATLIAGSARAQSVGMDTLPAFALPGTQTVHLHSAITGKEYQLAVALPGNYNASASSRYPVLYLLDGGISFPVSVIFYRINHREQDSLILVGISGPARTDVERHAFRQTYYTTPPSAAADSSILRQAKSGECCEAAKMAQSLREEIIPFIDGRYRTTGDRGISGVSYSALFVNYLLFAEPDLFQKYMMISPSLWWDNFGIFEQEARFAKTHTTLPKQVYISVASMEPMDMNLGIHRMAETLRARNYTGLDVSSYEQAGADHGSMTEYSRALDFLYPVRSNRVNLGGDSAKKLAARAVVKNFLSAYTRRDALGVRRFLARDSEFNGIIDRQIVHGGNQYAALLTARFKTMRNVALSFDSLRSEFDDPYIRMNVGYTESQTSSKVPSLLRGHLILELAMQPEGWLIDYALDNLPSRSQITTAVRVMADGRGVAGALVSSYTDWLTEDLASAHTDSTGIAHVPYEWHVVNNGYLQIRSPGYALAVRPLPTRDTVTVVLQKPVVFDASVVDRYVGTYSTGDGSMTERLIRDGRALVVEEIPINYRGNLPVVFLSPTRLLVRDGSVLAVTLDPTGRAVEFRHRGSRLIRKPAQP